MAKLHRALFVLSLLVSLSVFAQSADQEILSATDSPDPVIPGNNVTYTVQVRNNGPDAAVNGGLNISIGGSLFYVSGSGPAGFTCANIGNNASCTNPSFPSGTTATFTIVAQLDPSRVNFPDGTVVSTFGTSGTTIDPNNGNNFASVTTSYDSPQIDLSVAVSDSPDPVFPNQNVTYTIDVANAGPDTATIANFNIVYNGGTFTFQSIAAPAGWDCSSAPAPNTHANFSCTRASFPPGTGTFTVVMKADPAFLGLNDASVPQVFGVTGTGDDTNDLNFSETELTQYLTSDADLAVTNSDSPDPVSPGGTITYTQSIANNGPDAAPNATFSEILQSSVGFQSISAPAGFNCTTPSVGASGTITCTNPSLANGAGGAITVVVTVIASSGIVTNTIATSSNVQDPGNTDNSATVTTTILAPLVADLGITKTTSSGNAAAGASVAYTITLTNNGPDAASNVVVNDVLPLELLFQSINVPAGFNCTTPAVGANGAINCTASSMASGTTATFTLVVQLTGNAVGPINNTATATSDTDDNNTGNDSGNAPSVTVGGNGTADLAVDKSTQTTTTAPGDTVTYTITATNNGPDAATNVIVSDDLPAGLQFVSATPSQGSCAGTDPFTCNLGTLNNGSSATITLQALVTATSGTIANTATVTADTDDGNPGNNSSTPPAIPVNPGAQDAVGIPTLSEWALLMLVTMLGVGRSHKDGEPIGLNYGTNGTYGT